MLTDREREILRRLAMADGAGFAELTAIAGLDPARAFRGADLRGVEFGTADLAGYDFSDADLTGASLSRARIRGAIFTGAITRGVRWPRPKPKPEADGPPELSGFRREAVERMLADLFDRRRALALMPVGTGCAAVLEEVIVAAIERLGQGVLVVDTVAERERFAARLRARLGNDHVWTTRDTPFPRSGLHILNATYRMFNSAGIPDFIVPAIADGAVFTTSVEKLNQLTRAGGALIRDAIVATVDSLPVDAGRPDRRQLLARVRRLYGNPSFVLEVEDAVDLKLLRPVELIAYPDLAAVNARMVPRFGDDPRRGLEPLRPVAARLTEILGGKHAGGLLVLCRNENHVGMLRAVLAEFVAAEDLICPGARWNRDHLPQDPAETRGIILAPLTRQAMELARRHPQVAVIAPLGVARAQELAYRATPGPARRRDLPVVHDLIDAFAGFGR